VASITGIMSVRVKRVAELGGGCKDLYGLFGAI
jgi:hypothetical protein